MQARGRLLALLYAGLWLGACEPAERSGGRSAGDPNSLSGLRELPRDAEGVAAWNRARARGELGASLGESLRQSERGGAALAGIDLAGLDLQGALLGGASLQGADLRGTRLIKADLRGADLAGAKLAGARLDHALAPGMVLREVWAAGAQLRWLDLKGVDLRGAHLRRADLRGCSFLGAELAGADLRGADLRGADLSGVDLSEVQMAGVDLRGASSDGATRWPRSISKPLERGVEVDGVSAMDLALEAYARDRDRAAAQ